MLKSRLVDECRSTPRVLLLDEAHTMQPKICQSLLTLTQEVTDKAPFAGPGWHTGAASFQAS